MILFKIPIAITCQKIRLKFAKNRAGNCKCCFDPRNMVDVQDITPPWAMIKPRYLSIENSAKRHKGGREAAGCHAVALVCASCVVCASAAAVLLLCFCAF